jgi:hypothetical protein
MNKYWLVVIATASIVFMTAVIIAISIIVHGGV